MQAWLVSVLAAIATTAVLYGVRRVGSALKDVRRFTEEISTFFVEATASRAAAEANNYLLRSATNRVEAVSDRLERVVAELGGR